MQRSADHPAPGRKNVRFGVYEVDLRAGELRKRGTKIKLQEKPFRILAALLETPGEVVTREELFQKLWPADTFVDFEGSLNAAVKKLRDALSDSAENPRFVETLPKRGYRFVAPVDSPFAVVPAPEAEPPARRAPNWKYIAGATTALALLLTIAVSWPPTASGTIDSIAVLPLDNFSNDPEQDYFVNGMHEALIAELAQIQALGVISRTSMNQYRGTAKTVPEIASELDVDVVLEGSVMRAGDKVRITVQLIGTQPERHIWAEIYDRDLQDVLRLHSDVARAVAEQIEVAVTPDEAARLASTRDIDPVVYQHYLRGRELCVSQSESELYRGIDQFRQAVNHDPSYAPAHAGVAKCYSTLAMFFVPPEEVAPQVQAAVSEALRLDDELAEAHAMNGNLKLFFLRDFSGDKDFERAMELDPNSVTILMDYGQYLAASARFDEAISMYLRAVELDPLGATTVNDLGWANFVARRYDEAIVHLEKSLDLDSDFVYGHAWLSAAYAKAGMLEQASDFAAKAEALAPTSEDQNLLSAIGWVYATLGQREDAQRMIDRISRLALHRRVDPVLIGAIYGAMGEVDKALELLEESASKSGVAPFLAMHPFTDSMRSDPRFDAVLKRAGLDQ